MFIRQVVLAMMLVSLATHSSARANPPGTGKAQTIAATSPAMNLNDKADQDALMAIANDFMVAWQKQDMSTISDILAPDFLFAGPHGVVPKATTLKALSHCALGTFTLEDFQMRRTSSDSAVLIYKIHRDLECGGKKDLEDTLNTDAFIRRNGKWSIIVTTEGILPGH